MTQLIHGRLAFTKVVRRFGDFRALSVALLVVIVVMLAIWQPWRVIARTSDRTISVNGTAAVTAAPDQFVFTPSYTFTNVDKQVALKEVAAKSDEVVAGLKAIGVASKDIKTNANGYNGGYYMPVNTGENSYGLNMTVTVRDAALVQKVQDYMLTTTPSGDVTPSASFSTAKQQQLENQSRDQAEQNARARAERSARNLGFQIGSVKLVSDGGLGGITPYVYDTKNSVSSQSAAPQLAVQPGQNDLTYSVSVVYYIY